MDFIATPPNSTYSVISHTTSVDDNNTELILRCNGKVFYIHILPSRFHNSSATTTEYFTYLEVLRSGEEQIDGVFEDDFYEWASSPFQWLFHKLAPTTPPEETKISLYDYLFAEFFVYMLEAVDNKLVPRLAESQDSGHMPAGTRLDSTFLNSLRLWAPSFHPSDVQVSFERPEDALFKHPRKVLVDGGQTGCFFKPFFPGAPAWAETELNAYRKIAEADLGPNVQICRLYGVVQNEEGLLMGMLLTYINQYRTLCTAVWPETPASARNEWAR